jgi:hypothetical protein
MKILLIILSFIFCSIVLHAQNNETDKNDKLIGGGIYLLPTQLVFPEIVLTYEHFLTNRLSLSYSLGYKIPVGNGNVINEFGHGLFAIYEYQYMFNKFSNAIYLSIGPSYYLGHKRKFYLQCELFNRYYWFDKKRLAFDNVETYRYNSIRTERNNVTGIKILIGTNIKLSISGSYFLNFKIYLGPGLRYKIYNYENVNNIKNINGQDTIIPYNKELGSLILPSVQFGVKIGITGKSKR